MVNGLLVPFKGSSVSTATGVGALPSRDTMRFTTAAWASGKKSKWPCPGSGRGWERVGPGAAIGSLLPQAIHFGTGLYAPQAGG